MIDLPIPEDPLVRLAMERDPELIVPWAEFCAFQAAAGGTPTRPAPGMQSFRAFALKRAESSLPDRVELRYAAWRSAGPGEIMTRAKEKEQTAASVRHWWGDALDLLDQYLSAAEEFGMVHAHQLRAAGATAPLSFRVLNGLHARGVQVGEEVLALLRAGFAAGADARWRTLYETAVVAEFLARNGEETVQRYVDHDRVRVARAMQEEQRHHEALRIEPYTEAEMREAREELQALRDRYGDLFLQDYGWAAAALGCKPKGGRTTFVSIEASLQLGLPRAAYRSASEAIHAGPGALTDNPGAHARATPRFMTRGSHFGLLDAGARTPATIHLLSHALLSWRPFPLDVLSLQVMERMAADVARLFREAHHRLMAAFPADER